MTLAHHTPHNLHASCIMLFMHHAGLSVSPALAAGVSFLSPANNATVTSPLHVEMSVSGMVVKPAADGVLPGTGHFHVTIDSAPLAEGVAIPFDPAHKHYGKGQTSDNIDLLPVRLSPVLLNRPANRPSC